MNKANEEVVSAYRRAEMRETEKMLSRYLDFCNKSQVHAKFFMIEAGHVQVGIVDLVTRHGIQKLVMGAIPDNCLKVKGSSNKITYAAKETPPFCEIWFVCKGKHLWTREATEAIDSFLPSFSPDQTVLPIRSRDTIQFNSVEVAVSSTDSNTTIHDMYQTNSPTSASSCDTESLCGLASERRLSIEISSKVEQESDGVYNQLQEATQEIEKSKKKSFAEIAKRRKVESETSEAFNWVFEFSCEQETKISEELKDLLLNVRMQQAELVNEKIEATRELQNTMKTINVLDVHAQEVTHRCTEAAGELEVIHSSIEALVMEIQKFHCKRKEPLCQLERRKCHSYDRSPNCKMFYGFANDSCNSTEFSSSDLQTATCGFSESFKLGQGGYGCVYKGEMSNKTVVIKKLNQHNVQGQKEFEQEVYVLNKLRHPHLVTLIGVCPEALSLVYEYLPNGTLQNRLFCRTNNPLTWKARIRIAAEISSALLFLHSSKPERIIHGDLKPDNIFLDSNFSCKIGDFGICRLVPVDARYSYFFHCSTGPKGAFSYTDPEHQRSGVLTNKSDVFSFGIIILQLLTRKPPHGLANEVRRAMLANNLCEVLDPTAGEWPIDVAARLAEFGVHCSEMNSRNRPELTPELVRELEQLHLMEERPVPPFFLCPILQEIMHDPQVAADGFTYEGSAFREWLENGRDTSPMTNLKMEHLNLVPNHALRFAIQDWLCHPCRP